MSEPIQPALTPEQWADDQPFVVLDNDHMTGRDIMMYFVLWEDGTLHLGNRDAEGVFEADALPPTRHKLAALALYGQPFGFTWEMVQAIRRCADITAGEFPSRRGPWDDARTAADRIAALLPPE